VPRGQLYKLSPGRPRLKRLGSIELADRVRTVARAWWSWLTVAIVLQESGHWRGAVVAAGIAFVFYHTSADTHPAVFPLASDLSVDSADFRRTLEGVTGMPSVSGNRVTIYNNGDEFYPAMLDAVQSASRSITMEQYIYWDGVVGERFAEAFAKKARAGVPVKLLLDAIGSATLGGKIFRILEAGGCQVAWFHPIQWYTVHRATQRDHRKSLVVDGRIAFTGGAGLGDHWLGTAATATEWRDVQVSIAGPAALAQQSSFAQNWLATTGEILSGEQFFPKVERQGTIAVQTILSSPSDGAAAVGTMYLTALQCARRELLIANPYFVPDSRVTAMLAAARRRGVNIRLMLAGGHIDAWWARQNSIRRYGKLLEAGVEIYEFEPTMLHQKTMLVDGSWATIGTANFDNRSFALNEETSLCFHDRAVTRELLAIFEKDLKRCRQVSLEAWRRRGLWQRGKEAVASLIEDQI
jgi:cardiolipin synthase